jgi:formylmethanofuran dehydrogenase subunit E
MEGQECEHCGEFIYGLDNTIEKEDGTFICLNCHEDLK